jgi:hypothetical protein
MDGTALHQLLLEKWGRSYDVQLRYVQNRLYFQIMWKYLEQASFPLPASHYHRRLDHFAQHLSALQVTDQVKSFIAQTPDRPRVGKAISIPLAVDIGERAAEWLLED